eukprot:382775-Alexandrium_andersonii.AAC.1
MGAFRSLSDGGRHGCLPRMSPPARPPPPPPPPLAPAWPAALLVQWTDGGAAADGSMSTQRAGTASHGTGPSGTLSDEE